MLFTTSRHNTTFSLIFVRRFPKGKGYGCMNMNTHANKKYIGNACDSCVLVYGRSDADE